MSIIEIKNLGKKYNITHQRGGYVALRDVLMNVLKSPFSFLKSKAKQVAGMETKEEFWALKDINFEVQKGEVVGIIGANGAGKSTLLKILSQITPPTTGEIKIHGRVGSLLEVGTGFHPELTGRENIFLNGAILGMTRNEMAKKFDAIVEFSGIEKFLDTPVKYYSSGMYVRLAFSVAAHMEPDILIVDEVLAVGDAEFQKKCLGKMEEVTKQEGRTILFVSHNMEAIQNICTKCILMKDGNIKAIGPTSEIISEYLGGTNVSEILIPEDVAPHKEGKITSIKIKSSEGQITNNLTIDKPFSIEIEYELRADLPAFPVLIIYNKAISNTHLLASVSNDNDQKVPGGIGQYKASVKIDPVLNAGRYSLLIGITTNCRHYIDKVIGDNMIIMTSTGALPFPTATSHRPDSIFVTPLEWKTDQIITPPRHD